MRSFPAEGVGDINVSPQIDAVIVQVGIDAKVNLQLNPKLIVEKRNRFGSSNIFSFFVCIKFLTDRSVKVEV